MTTAVSASAKNTTAANSGIWDACAAVGAVVVGAPRIGWAYVTVLIFFFSLSRPAGQFPNHAPRNAERTDKPQTLPTFETHRPFSKSRVDLVYCIIPRNRPEPRNNFLQPKARFEPFDLNPFGLRDILRLNPPPFDVLNTYPDIYRKL
jgi:hypothetical protein